MTLVIKVKVESIDSQLKSHITKQLLTSISVDIRICYMTGENPVS